VDNRTQLLFMLCDIVLCLVSFTLAHSLRYDNFSMPEVNESFYSLLPWVVLIRMPVFIYFGFYHTLIRHLSFYDIKVVFKGVAVSSLILVGFFFICQLAVFAKYGRGVFLIDWFCLTNLLAGYRILLKKFHRAYQGQDKSPDCYKRVLIWGAGDGGELCLRYLQKEKEQHYEVIGFIDDDPKKRNCRLNGKLILGSKDHLKVLIELYKIQEVFVAMPSAAINNILQALEFCYKLGVEAKLFQLSTKTYSNTSLQQASASPIEDSLSSYDISIA